MQKIIETGMGIVMVVLSAILLNYYGEQANNLQEDEAVYAVYYDSESDETAVEEKSQESESTNDSSFCVVLDAGHGGEDPGKIGVNQEEEKDINLAIVNFIKEDLESTGVKVVLTRESDAGLYVDSSSNKKIEDMNKRCEIMNESQASLAVSIHQNSYHEESVKGPQVFYYTASEKGKQAAELIQKQFDSVIGAENNTRQAKANDNYYLLLHTEIPVIICECGFLSNWEEAQKLVQEDYQKQVSAAISDGIREYLSIENDNLSDSNNTLAKKD